MAVQCAEDNADDDECDADLKNMVCSHIIASMYYVVCNMYYVVCNM